MAIRRTWPAAALLAAVLWIAPMPARASAPTEAIRAQVDRAVEVLKDPSLKGEEHTPERRAAIRTIADAIFDFTEMARRALAQHWRARTPDEQKRFVRLFGDLLERAYFSRIDSYQGESVRYLGDRIDGEEATVRTIIVTRSRTEVPVNYRMLREDGRWRVYDVIIEGVSLVNNYRSQFDRIIRVESYDALVRKLEARAASDG